MTIESRAPDLPFRLWAQPWARLLTFWGTAASAGVEVVLLLRASDFGIPATVPLMLVFGIPVWLFARAALLHVRVTSDGVRVFNPLHTYDLRWDEIKDVESINQLTGIGGYARIVRTDDSKIALAVSNFGIRGDPLSAQRIVVPLKQALERERARTLASP